MAATFLATQEPWINNIFPVALKLLFGPGLFHNIPPLPATPCVSWCIYPFSLELLPHYLANVFSACLLVIFADGSLVKIFTALESGIPSRRLYEACDSCAGGICAIFLPSRKIIPSLKCLYFSWKCKSASSESCDSPLIRYLPLITESRVPIQGTSDISWRKTSCGNEHPWKFVCTNYKLVPDWLTDWLDCNFIWWWMQSKMLSY